MRIICMVAGHWRSFKRARRDYDRAWRSECRWCKVPMIRLGRKHWVVEEREKNVAA
ncbi:MAG TPA: hypothetical protein VGW34_06005 [Allosphingosinicella sp.]|nr:hypothetical protein [Allosphingosinicella sp.]